MKKRIILTALATTALALGGCSGEKASDSSSSSVSGKTKKSKVVDVYVSQMDNIADALEEVTDEKSAKKAAQAITKASKELEALSETVEGMSDIEKGMMFASRSQDFVAVQTRLATSMQKIAAENPEYIEMIQEEMEKMPEWKK
ncbi:MAG: hypothetical protein DHS20C05_19310 [Hyphococcus sp.]|nr:MAG: hypothetical protein DHS20C05_19310 [Marinicaulis sp.]